jgi:hypothetical protein
MLASIRVKQLKLAVSWLSSAAKIAGHPEVAGVIDLALKSGNLAETMRPGQDDTVAQALRQVRAELEEGTRQALAAEFGAGWEARADLAATINALPQVIDRYIPNTDAILAANLDPARIAELATDAADAAHEDLFCKGTLGARMLRDVIFQTYVAALRNKDLALRLLLRAQQEILLRQDQQNEKLNVLLAEIRQIGVPLPTLQRILVEGFGEPNIVLDRDRIEEVFVAKAEEHRALLEQVNNPGNDEQQRALKLEMAGLEICVERMEKNPRRSKFFSILNSGDPINDLSRLYGWRVWSDNWWGSLGYYLLISHEKVNHGKRTVVARKFEIDRLKKALPGQWHIELDRGSEQVGPVLVLNYSYFRLYADPKSAVGGVIYRKSSRDVDFYAPLSEWTEKLAAILHTD